MSIPVLKILQASEVTQYFGGANDMLAFLDEHSISREDTDLKHYKTKNTANNDGVKMQYRGVNEYGVEVYETSADTLKLTWAQRKTKYLDVMKNEYANKKARFIRNGHIYYAEFDKSSLRKPIYGDNRSTTGGVKALIKAGADGDIFNLVENSKYTGSQVNTKQHTNADYFDYFIKTVQIDNKVFDLVADVEKKYGVKDGYVYTIALIDNKK